MKLLNIQENIRTDIAHYSAILERIATITRNTCARWSMIYNLTFGKLSADTKTWISTLWLYASKNRYAICINHTFWSTSFIRIANIIW